MLVKFGLLMKRWGSQQSNCIGSFSSSYLKLEAKPQPPLFWAEFGHYHLHFHGWQQILRYHNRIDNLPDDECLVKCAVVESLHVLSYHSSWSHDVLKWLQLQSTALNAIFKCMIGDEIGVSTVTDNTKILINRLC